MSRSEHDGGAGYRFLDDEDLLAGNGWRQPGEAEPGSGASARTTHVGAARGGFSRPLAKVLLGVAVGAAFGLIAAAGLRAISPGGTPYASPTAPPASPAPVVPGARPGPRGPRPASRRDAPRASRPAPPTEDARRRLAPPVEDARRRLAPPVEPSPQESGAPSAGDVRTPRSGEGGVEVEFGFER